MGANNPTYHTIIGSSDIVQLPDKRMWNLVDGVQTFQRFAGTSDAIAEKFNELSTTANSGVDDLDENIDGKSGRLLARILEDSGGTSGGNTEELNAIWEIIGQDIYKPIEAHYYFKDITAKHKRGIEKAARDAEPIPATDPDGIAWTPSSTETTLYAYYAHQTLDYAVAQFILRKSTVVSSRSKITLSYVGINTVVAKDATELTANIKPPSALLGALTSLPRQGTTPGPWEWLKKAPQLRQISKRKFQVVYEWHGAEYWSLRLYGGTWVPLYAT